MKREDFKIAGIPEGYRVYDVDLTPSGRPVALAFTRDTDKDRIAFMGGEWRRNLPLPKGGYAQIAIGPNEGALLVGGGHYVKGGDNAWLLNSGGEVLHATEVGHGVNHILLSDEFIVLTYIDEGVMGSALGAEGIRVYDHKLQYRFGYKTALGDRAVEIWDCYSAVWGDDGWLVFTSYPDWPLVELKLRTLEQQVWQTPREFKGAFALSFLGGDVLTFHDRIPEIDGGHGNRGEISAWRRGDLAVRRLRRVARGRYRGLPGGRFLTAQPDGYTILSFD